MAAARGHDKRKGSLAADQSPQSPATLVAIAANTFSGVAALVHFRPILPGMVKAGVPESWLTFPIGTLKTAGALGLLLSACLMVGLFPR